MSQPASGVYRMPPRLHKADGELRRVGFELEFTGLTLDEASEAVQQALQGSVSSATAAAHRIAVAQLGSFRVEVDWNYLKKLAEEHPDYHHELTLLSDTASLIVPVEVVCPPLAITRLNLLDSLVVELRKAGAQGTDNSLFAAYGVHVNAEIPEVTAPVIDAYLKAFCLLQWWLVKAHKVNLTRRITPYVDLYPDRYLKQVLSTREPTVDQLIDDYLHYNPTRNRALDLLPLFAHIDAARVAATVDDPRIRARPTFHYRLPDCLIDRPDWHLARTWNLWCVLEELASRPDDLDDLGRHFLEAWRPAFGVDEADWINRVEKWVKKSGLV